MYTSHGALGCDKTVTPGIISNYSQIHNSQTSYFLITPGINFQLNVLGKTAAMLVKRIALWLASVVMRMI